ncbi:uncharacterized protein LOC119369092 [Jatropha curcas]|uniref:uncharacterized protein LOC119369092 n=1 Tax=Jatropha curcas TaxID=180498 RepID=UPI00189396AF|nr:uncharacterized protein LOC119369092 [Jatropha curcas]
MDQTRPKDQELIRIFNRSLLPYFKERMLVQPLIDFSLVQRAGLNIEELYKEEKKKSRGFGNYRSSYSDSYSDQSRNARNAAMNQSGSSNTVGAVNEKVRREFTDLGRPLSTVMRSCIKNGVLSKLPVNPSKPIRGRLLDRNCEYHQCKGHSTDDCFKLRHDIQNLIDSGKIHGKITKPF